MACLALVVLFTSRDSQAIKSQRSYSDYPTPTEIRDEFTNVFLSLQPKLAVALSSPTVTDLDEFDMVVSSIGSKNLMVKVGNDIYYVPMTKLP